MPGITRTVKRDKYGRYKGKAGIKPFKSNLKGVTRKGAPNKGARRTTGTVRKRMSNRRKAALAGAAVVGTVALSRGARSANDAIQRKRGYTIAYHNTSIKGARKIQKEGFSPNIGKGTNRMDHTYVTNKRRGGASKWINGHSSMGDNHVTLRIKTKLPKGVSLEKDHELAASPLHYRLARGEKFNRIHPKHLQGAKVTKSRYIYGNIAIDSAIKGISLGAKGVGKGARGIGSIKATLSGKRARR